MKINDIYNRMCELSPIRKDWEPEKGNNTDKGILTLVVKNHNGVCWIDGIGHYKKDLIWYLRQEDWQKIYWNYQSPIDEMCEEGVETINHHLQEIDYSFTDLSTYEMSGNIITKPSIVKGLNHQQYPELYTMLWCLLIHDRVYDLIWDWIKNEWVER